MSHAPVEISNRNSIAAGIATLKIHSRLRLALLHLALLIAALLLCCARVQASGPTQDDVEAAYLYKLGNFVQWPSSNPPAAGPKYFSICVLGRDPFGNVLDDTLRGSKMNGYR